MCRAFNLAGIISNFSNFAMVLLLSILVTIVLTIVAIIKWFGMLLVLLYGWYQKARMANKLAQPVIKGLNLKDKLPNISLKRKKTEKETK